MYADSIIKNFESKIDKRGHDDCWEWLGGKSHEGYGHFGLEGKTIRAHRFSYTLFYGDPPMDKPLILHKCNNKSCVNPYHLYAGTASDNAKDLIESGYVHKDHVPKTAYKMFIDT